jgi:hypothetical protein
MGFPKKVLKTDIIPYPSVLTADTAVTYTSDEYSDFETSNYGGLDLILKAADDSAITNTHYVYADVSFDEGTTWLTAGRYTDLVKGSNGALCTTKSLKYVPRFRARGYFDVSGAFTVTAGLSVDAYVKEYEENYRRDFEYAVYTPPTTMAIDFLGSSSGIVTSSTGTFLVLLDDGTAGSATTKTVALTANCASAGAMVTHVNAKLVCAGIASTVLTTSNTTSAGIFFTAGVGGDGHYYKLVDGTNTPLVSNFKIPNNTILEYSSDEPGTSIELPDSTVKVVLIAQCADLSKITGTFPYNLQFSTDGVYWYDNFGTDKTDITYASSGLLYTENDNETDEPIGKYARVNFKDDNDGALASGHGVKFSILYFYV